MTETDSMVERVARAIGMTIPNRREATYVTPYTMLAARAAIEAMKEPTPVVLEEGYDKLDFYDELSDAAEEYNRRVVQRVWSAMIRKALEE